jgi:hypothetical protein
MQSFGVFNLGFWQISPRSAATSCLRLWEATKLDLAFASNVKIVGDA